MTPGKRDGIQLSEASKNIVMKPVETKEGMEIFRVSIASRLTLVHRLGRVSNSVLKGALTTKRALTKTALNTKWTPTMKKAPIMKKTSTVKKVPTARILTGKRT